MIDTIRILVSYECNCSCSYCCNNLEHVRSQIKPVRLEEIDFGRYQTVCITGGEPLMFMERIHDICARVPAGKLKVLYTNGLKLDRATARRLKWEGIGAINVGLHNPYLFDWLIERVTSAVSDLGISVRFHVEDTHRELAERYPEVAFRIWRLNDCDRANEERVVLIRSGL